MKDWNKISIIVKYSILSIILYACPLTWPYNHGYPQYKIVPYLKDSLSYQYNMCYQLELFLFIRFLHYVYVL